MKFIEKNEKEELTFLQITGLILILIGTLIICIASFIEPSKVAPIIAIAFFITMLGLAFAFPSLLKGNEGLSTMRIVVFMVTNVICMLLLKIGWNKESLKQIELNQYWMGVIAFVFGAKATQSFFESRMAIPSEKHLETNSVTKEMAIKVVNELKYRKDPRIYGVGYLPKMEDGEMKYIIHVNVNSDVAKQELENYEVKNDRGETVKPEMQVIVTSKPKKHSSKLPGTGIENKTKVNGIGTFGCVVINDDSKRCILSCQHVLKGDQQYDVINDNTSILLINNIDFATHIKGTRTNDIDAGLAVLKDQNIDNRNLGIIRGERDTTDYDVAINKRVRLKGFDIDSEMTIPQFGFIINNGFDVLLDYEDGKNDFLIKETIVISENTSEFKTISKPGYSGSLVLDEDGYIIGMVVGGDEKFTYAIPINKIINELKFKILK